MKPFTKKLVLENGREFYGYGYGADVERVCEIVFNTSVVGYQEIISDPSNLDQIVVMAYPLIGNYGITDEDFESKLPMIGGMVVRECNENPSNFRYTKTLSEYLEENDIPGICGVDTRKLTRFIRDNGTQNAIVKVEHLNTYTKYFTVTDIDVTGAVGIDYEILTSALSVQVRGTIEELARLKTSDFTAIVDLNGYSSTASGVITKTVTLYIDSAYAKNVYEIGEYTVQVRLN